MRMIADARLLPGALAIVFSAGCSALHRPAQQTPSAAVSGQLQIRQHHAHAYAGPLQFATRQPDGSYSGATGSGEVRGGRANVVVALPAGGEVMLRRTGALRAPSKNGPLTIRTLGHVLDVQWQKRHVGTVELGLVVAPGTKAGPSDAVTGFRSADFEWSEQPDGAFTGRALQDGFLVTVILNTYAGGWLDMHARLVRVDESMGPAYVALVRRVAIVRPGAVRMRFNGRLLDGADSPELIERDFWYPHGVDWISWKAGALRFASVAGFTPAPTTLRDTTWMDGSSFYVLEKSRLRADGLYLISQVAGPNEQAKSMRATPYAPMRKGDTVDLKWRLAIDPAPPGDWEESQLFAFAGYRSITEEAAASIVDIGVPAVAFGTSYFPYSTFAENFDYYRTPGLNSESWWPFSARTWRMWKSFAPRMQTDMHIIRAMGFEWVRLHHLELLQQMERAEALAFLDWFTATAKQLDLKILVDTEGPAEWITLMASRYGDVISRFELENEILIFGIKPRAPARWTELYHATKRAAPGAQVFLTGAGNNGMFERLRSLGVPFDRVGLHAYKHGPEWKEAFSSHALGTGGYASDIGKPTTLGEFNWKSLTRLSPETRRTEFATIYELMLKPRAFPEFFQFHFQETLSVNPAIARIGVRHYETISLDRRPKPEALELMRLMRQYARADAPARELSIEVPHAQRSGRTTTVAFKVTNQTDRSVNLELRTVAFDGADLRLVSPARNTLAPNESVSGTVEVRLDSTALAGTYHYFIIAAYDDREAYGWGTFANIGKPTFAKESVLKERVTYPQGADVVEQIGWGKPIFVVFGAAAPVLEMEMAYLVGNTLQSATGQRTRIASHADLPLFARDSGLIILIGTPESNPLIEPADMAAGKGVIRLQTDAGRQQLSLAGVTPRDVSAAATEFVLRYWQTAKDATIRITGMEPGAALGHRLKAATVDVP